MLLNRVIRAGINWQDNKFVFTPSKTGLGEFHSGMRPVITLARVLSYDILHCGSVGALKPQLAEYIVHSRRYKAKAVGGILRYVPQTLMRDEPLINVPVLLSRKLNRIIEMIIVYNQKSPTDYCTKGYYAPK